MSPTPSFTADPDTGELLDTRDLPRTIRALLSAQGHPQCGASTNWGRCGSASLVLGDELPG